MFRTIVLSLAILFTSNQATSHQNNLKPIYYLSGMNDKVDEKNINKNYLIFKDRKTSLKGYKDKSDKIIIPAQFHQACHFNKYGIANVCYERTRNCYKINTSGKNIAKSFEINNGPDYEVDNMSRIVKNNKVGYIDNTGKIIIPPQFDWIGIFNLSSPITVVSIGCVSVRVPNSEYSEMKGGKWGAIDKTGKIIVPIEYDEFDGYLPKDKKTLTFKKGDQSFELYEVSPNQYKLIPMH
ncbi:MAG: WG repeat-containing protein [Alphaproteobacteria bacterium]|nr:WG repeat-containing protein [Alphaproteobacteria bacterium]